jgi:hypothetical protein
LRHARPGECGAVSLSTRVCSSRRTTWPGRDLCLPTALVGFPTLRSLVPAAGVVASPRPTGPRAFSTARPVPRFIFVGDRTALLVAARATSPPANRSTASSSWASGLVSRLRSVSAVVAPGTAAALGFASRRVVGATRHTPFPRTFASPVPGHRFRRLSARGFCRLRRGERPRVMRHAWLGERAPWAPQPTSLQRFDETDALPIRRAFEKPSHRLPV